MPPAFYVAGHARASGPGQPCSCAEYGAGWPSLSTRHDMNARFAQVDARLGELREDLCETHGLLQEALRARAS